MIKENAMAKKPKIDKTFLVKDLETLKVLSDPLRMDILRLISFTNLKGRFATVKDLAEELDMPATKLYYHINLLEKHGLILVGDTQIVSGIIEKRYQVVAEDISIHKHIIATDESSKDEQLDQLLETLSSMLDSAYLNLKKSLKTLHERQQLEKETDPDTRMKFDLSFSNTEFYLTTRQAKELKRKLTELMEEYDSTSNKNIQKDAEGLNYGCTMILTPHYHRSINPYAGQPTQGEQQND
jgi:DNA-binding transcriptional ArsR family regulator